EHVPKEYAASDKYRLVWNDDPTSTMTIIWDQLKGDEATVLYSKKDFGRKHRKYQNKQMPTRKLMNFYQMNTCYAKLANLEPDQTYYFVIKDKTGVSERYYFHTAPDKPKSFTFISGGDTKSTGTAYLAGVATNKMVAKLRPLFVQFNGDFTSGNGTNPEYWHQWLTDWDSLTTTFDGRKIPIVPVHGNHENGNKKILNKIFDAPFQGSDSTNIYYSLSFGDKFFHTIVLNSEIETGGDQREWLKADLEAHQDFIFKIAGYHKPFWPHTAKKKDKEYQYEQWADLFYEYGLDLSMDADAHLHKITYPLKPVNGEDVHQGHVRDDEKGTMFIGEGSWGAGHRVNNDDKPWTYQSGSFNQLKWIHVKPVDEEQPASLEIFTVITSQKDTAGVQSFYVDEVESLSEDNFFQIPKNINLFVGSDSLKSVKYPFSLNKFNKDDYCRENNSSAIKI
ncbi:metallophosphoesterase family protein, partial [bacterium]|nr:metallophosphoesterase family protein [bacterium]